jgi:hypothetical protein
MPKEAKPDDVPLHEETDSPTYADDHNFYKVEKWTRDGTKVAIGGTLTVAAISLTPRGKKIKPPLAAVLGRR